MVFAKFCVSRSDPRLTALLLQLPLVCKFGELKADLAAKGMPVEDADVLSAVTALVHGMPVAAGNVGHFEHFVDLVIVEW